jgi:hypothetical protein
LPIRTGSYRFAAHCKKDHSHNLPSFALAHAHLDNSFAGLTVGHTHAHHRLGNVATEDVVHLLHSCGVATGCDLTRLLEVSTWVAGELGGVPDSAVARAYAGSALSATLATKTTTTTIPS